MKTNWENLEKTINEALELKEKGKAIPEILALYPEYKEELKEIFQTIDILNKGKENVLSPKELLVKILFEAFKEKTVTKEEFGRYLYRGVKEPGFAGFKGRPSVVNLEGIVNFMTRKVYLGIVVVVLVILVGAGIYWQLEKQKTAVSPIESETSLDEQSLEQDITDLETLEKDQSLGSLDQDLSDIAQEAAPATSGQKIDIASLENLESDLSSELNSVSADLSDLSGFESDTSLGDLDAGLSGI